MNLDSLNRGDKYDLHILLFGAELDVLDALCIRYNCSRAAVIGAMLRDAVEKDLSGHIPPTKTPGVRPRRR